MAYPLSELFMRFYNEKKLHPGRGTISQKWFREEAAKITRVNATKLRDELISEAPTSVQASQVLTPGHLYLFNYNAKHKDTLPYWDAFPIVFPFSVEHDRFRGINLHYLPLDYRAVLMAALFKQCDDVHFTHRSKLKLNWEILKGFSQYKMVQPCVKEYLFDHVRGRAAWVNPQDWASALFLPLQRFQKASSQTVWNDSVNKAKGY